MAATYYEQDTRYEVDANVEVLGNVVASNVSTNDGMISAETWTFMVDDGQGGTTTVTKQVAVYAAAQGAGA
jgi:hypothetical protein